MSLPCQRQHFDIPSSISYLNCAYMGPLSHRVLAAGVEGLGRKARPWKIGSEDFFEDVEVARELFARVIGGDSEGVALLPSVSYGIACAARNLPVPAGSEIVVLADAEADPRYVAADMLSQAEHGSGFEAAVCITPSAALAEQVASLNE